MTGSRPRPRSLWPALTALVLALAAGPALTLASDAEITRVRQGPLYDVNALGGPIPTYVYGAPAQGALASDWLAPIRLPGRFRGARLIAADPARHWPEGTRLVLLFNHGYQEAGPLCRDPSRAEGTSGAGGGYRGYIVYAVMCSGKSYVVRGLMKAGPVTGPSDPAYAQHMARFVDALFPPKGPSHSSP